MQIEREPLVNLLKKVSKAIDNYSIVPEYQNFRISNNKIQATNGSMLVEVNSVESLGLTCSVPGQQLLTFLKNISNPKLDVSINKNKLVVKTNFVKGSFTIVDKVNILDVPISDDSLLTKDKEVIDEFIDGLVQCSLTVSNSSADGILCGVNVNGDLMSCSKYRITKYLLKNQLGINCTVPATFINFLKEYKDEICELYCSGSTFTAAMKDNSFASTNVFSEEYPDFDKHFPNSEGVTIDFGEDFDTVLNRHIDFLKNISFLEKEMKIDVVGNKITLTSKNSEYGELVEEIELVDSIESVNVSFLINPLFLKEMNKLNCVLKYFNEEKIVMLENEKFKILIQLRQ